MGMFSGSLGSDLSRYRKRKTISLDGTVAGLSALHYRHGPRPVSGDLPVAPQEPELYDPQTGGYQSSGPNYEPPEPWFATTVSSGHAPFALGQMFRPGPPVLRQSHVDNDDIVTPGDPLDEMVWELEALQPAEPLPFEATAEPVAEMAGPQLMVDPPDYDACQMTDELFNQAMNQAFEPAIPELEPEPPDPYEQALQIYDEQMAQLMDPFGMPGFGPG